MLLTIPLTRHTVLPLMPTPRPSPRRSRTGPLLVLAAVLLVALAACDSGGPDPDPADVAGIYTFEQLTFDITAPGFPDVSVLDTLQAAQLILRNSGFFYLEYQFKDDDEDVVAAGTFSVTDDRVRLNAEEADAPFFTDILLPPELALTREGNVLTATVTRTVDLEEFNPEQYPGLESVRGTLRIRLTE